MPIDVEVWPYALRAAVQLLRNWGVWPEQAAQDADQPQPVQRNATATTIQQTAPRVGQQADIHQEMAALQAADTQRKLKARPIPMQLLDPRDVRAQQIEREMAAQQAINGQRVLSQRNVPLPTVFDRQPIEARQPVEIPLSMRVGNWLGGLTARAHQAVQDYNQRVQSDPALRYMLASFGAAMAPSPQSVGAVLGRAAQAQAMSQAAEQYRQAVQQGKQPNQRITQIVPPEAQSRIVSEQIARQRTDMQGQLELLRQAAKQRINWDAPKQFKAVLDDLHAIAGDAFVEPTMMDQMSPEKSKRMREQMRPYVEDYIRFNMDWMKPGVIQQLARIYDIDLQQLIKEALSQSSTGQREPGSGFAGRPGVTASKQKQ